MNFNRLKHIRQQVYASFEQGADALFNLADALLSESQAQSLPELSLSPFFERQWPSVYEALEDGRINVEQIRAIWVSVLLADRAGLVADLRALAEPDREAVALAASGRAEAAPSGGGLAGAAGPGQSVPGPIRHGISRLAPVCRAPG